MTVSLRLLGFSGQVGYCRELAGALRDMEKVAMGIWGARLELLVLEERRGEVSHVTGSIA